MATPSSGRQRGRPPYPLLTPAEERVLGHLRQGLTNAEIATRLGVSPDAVKYHVSNMLGKLGLESREQLAAWREPGGLRRVWAAAPWVGWKVAAAASGAAVVAVAGIVAWGLSRGDSDPEVTFGPEDLFVGVLSFGIDGELPNGNSANPSISDDGRFIAFESEASNLVTGDTNGVSDIFVVDRVDRSIRRVSVPPGGGEANGASHRPAISGDGEWVAFDSEASNLVKDDVNGDMDRVLAALPEQTRELVSTQRISTLGAAFIGGNDVFVVSRARGTLQLVSVSNNGAPGDLGSYWPSISRDGRFVAFESVAPSLTGTPAREYPSAGINPLLASDVFLRDRSQRTTTLVSRDQTGRGGGTGSGRAVVSSDGSSVVFTSTRTDLAGEATSPARAAYLWKRGFSQLQLVPLPPAPADSDGVLFVGEMSRPAIASDGSAVAYAMSAHASRRPDPEGIDVSGVFVYALGAAAPQLIPGTDGIGQSNSSVSFTADATTLVFQAVENRQLYVGEFDLVSGIVRRIAPPTGSPPYSPVVSGDGKWLAALQESGGRSQSGRPLFQIVVFPR